MVGLKFYGNNDLEIDNLIRVVKVVSEDSGTQLEFEKFAALRMKTGK